MGGFSIWHILIFAIILLLLFGGNRFSSMMGDVAKGLKSFKQGMADDEDETTVVIGSWTYLGTGWRDAAEEALALAAAARAREYDQWRAERHRSNIVKDVRERNG